MKRIMKKTLLLVATTALLTACSLTNGDVSSNHNSQSSQASTSSQNSSNTSYTSENSSNSVQSNNNQPSSSSSTGEIDVVGNAEYVFEDMTFQYDGEEHAVLINGLLPYGYTVQYENNTLTEVNENGKEATAKIYDESNTLVATKKAKIRIIPYKGLPNVRIVTDDNDDPNWKTREYENMGVSIDNCDDAYIKNNERGEIKVRGNSTNQEQVAKRAFRLKFAKKTNLLGLGKASGITKEKSWVLLADFFDQSMFRNITAFTMGNALFNYKSNLYSSDFMHVNLYMNGEYRGVYLLAEQQQARTSRVPVIEAEESDTGTNIGYLVEIDGLVSTQNRYDKTTGIGVSEGDPCFMTNVSNNAGKVGGVSIGDKPYVIKTDTFNDAQTLFIRKYITNCTIAFANTCNGNLKVVDANGDIQDSPYTTAYDTLNSFIDIDSFFRMYVLQEFAKNFDVGWGSFYMYVDFSPKSTVKRLTMSAPWDFDLGLGNKNSGFMTGNVYKSDDDFLNNSSYANGMTTFNPWLYMLSKTDFFDALFLKYYSAFNNSGIYERIVNSINYETKVFATEFTNTYDLVGYSSDKGASGSTLMQTRQYKKHEDAVTYLLNWLNSRKQYLDGKYLK